MMTWLVMALACATADNPTLFVEANSAYEGGQFERAAGLYEQLIDRGGDSGWLYFNLGNAYLRAGSLGQAVASYRRAEARLPRDADVVANLAFARKQTKDALAPVEPLPFMRTLFFWHFGLNHHELLYTTAALNAVFWLMCALARWRREAELPRWGAFIVGFALVLSAASLVWRSVSASEIAVMLEPEVEVHSGTHRDTVVRFKLHEGSEARLVDAREGWLRIELADGKQGWVDAGDVARVRL